MVLLIRERSMSTRLAETLSVAFALVIENKQSVTMTAILNILYKLLFLMRYPNYALLLRIALVM